ncbi:diaminopimelate decarboxylase [Saccharothrix syringae]|uniref:Diaminopimelate decarboxylase n=1 Tax=Saccharothrix syringae TaxID=103733 RepID=A0A5Q0HDE8_SACSY|nr:diaminopimelate decarboxylase [Saccharothrix syringae]QFZ23652.1 diaminopimelate decarboxylase [Saccharothrix syringae]
MTLSELLPSLGASLPATPDPRLWPAALSDEVLVRIAATFGTPTYVLSEDDVRAQCRRFRAALPGVEVAYASKALTCRAVLRWVREEGLSLDVCSAGELAVARAAGFPAERVLFHGNAKTPEDFKAIRSCGVGRVVVDSPDELDHLTDQRVLLRVTPDVAADTHPALATGVSGQKFGMDEADLASAVRRLAGRPDLAFAGLHCHIGSQVRHVATFERAARRMVEVVARCPLPVAELDLGGGFGVPYTPEEPDFDLTGYADRITRALHYECARHRVRPPRVVVEPGRAIVARAGVTVYRVTSVKHSFVAVDGGMSDNARPALYQARYAPRLLRRGGRTRRVTVVGRHCEAGDVLARDVPLPGDVHPGDLLAVPVTGAYHHSLASNYNQVGRPALVGVRDGATSLLVRAEAEDDLLRRDVG